MTPKEMLAVADRLVGAAVGGGGRWSRTAAVLGRQAIEAALRDYWNLRQPGLEGCSGRAQLLCLVAYLRDQELARATAGAWSDLSRACHHHPYELSPTAGELHGWLDTARAFAAEVERQVASR